MANFKNTVPSNGKDIVNWKLLVGGKMVKHLGKLNAY